MKRTVEEYYCDCCSQQVIAFIPKIQLQDFETTYNVSLQNIDMCRDCFKVYRNVLRALKRQEKKI